MATREQKLQQFAEKLGVKFENIENLNIALTHRSYLNENRDFEHNHNERYEFLGDAVLELIVSEHLFQTYPDRPEGELTSFRAATVKTDTLAGVSRKLGVGKVLQMSKGEKATGGQDKDYLLANSFESILGAIYLDQGYDEAKAFVDRVLVPYISEVVKHRLDIDPKTKFQELSQRLFKITPSYVLVEAEGPDHDKTFTMAVRVGDKEYGRGTGASKQRAEEAAAEEALKRIQKMDDTNIVA